jgi:hypothetical protein
MAVKGRNGFVCIVGRGWTSAPDSEFWNPKVRVPMCVNAAAARSYLLRIAKITELALAGHTLAQVNEAVEAAIARKELPPMESGAMCYMMSKQGYGGDTAPHWPSHLMFFYSDMDPAIWGANLPGSPIIAVADPMEHLTQFVIPTQKWSDGTDDLPATPHVHPSSGGTRVEADESPQPRTATKLEQGRYDKSARTDHQPCESEIKLLIAAALRTIKAIIWG